jgi:hypothetical protein
MPPRSFAGRRTTPDLITTNPSPRLVYFNLAHTYNSAMSGSQQRLDARAKVEATLRMDDGGLRTECRSAGLRWATTVHGSLTYPTTPERALLAPSGRTLRPAAMVPPPQPEWKALC